MPRKTQKKTAPGPSSTQAIVYRPPKSNIPQAIVLRTPVSPITGVILNAAFFDSSVFIGQLMRSNYYIRVSCPDTNSYYHRFLSGSRDQMLLDKTLIVKDRLAFTAFLAPEKGFSELEHIVGRAVWSFIGPETMYPIPTQRPTKRARV
jgi:hypothetical protein